MDDALYAGAVSALGEEGVVDLVGILGYYSLISMTINAFRVPPPKGAVAGARPVYCSVPFLRNSAARRGLDGGFLKLRVAEHQQWNVHAGIAEAPYRAEHVRQVVHWPAVDSEHDIAGPQAGPVRRTVAVDADHHQRVVVVVHQHAQPRAGWLGPPSPDADFVHHRRQDVDGHEHVYGVHGLVRFEPLDHQGPDAA